MYSIIAAPANDYPSPFKFQNCFVTFEVQCCLQKQLLLLGLILFFFPSPFPCSVATFILYFAPSHFSLCLPVCYLMKRLLFVYETTLSLLFYPLSSYCCFLFFYLFLFLSFYSFTPFLSPYNFISFILPLFLVFFSSI